MDYIQLLMIGQAIQAKYIDQNTKRPKSLKNKMFIFLLRLTSDDQLSDPSKKHQLKGKKMKRAP